MAITYRSVKGSALTITELDNNFRHFTGSHSITGSLIVSGSSVDFTGATGVSGSFSGSFTGDGSGLTGITSTPTAGTVSSSAQITTLGFVTHSALAPFLTNSSTSSLGTLTTANFTGSFTGSFTGDGSGLTGVTSTPTAGTVSSSAQITTLGFVTSSATSSFLTNSSTSSFGDLTNANFTGSFTGSFTGDGSGLTGITTEWDGTHTGNATFSGSASNTFIVSGSTIDFTNTTAISGSTFSGSFVGDGSNLTGITSTPTAGTVSSSAQITTLGFVTSSATASFLTNSSTSSFGTLTTANFTGSFTGSFTGDGSGLTGLSTDSLWTGSNGDISRNSNVVITGSLSQGLGNVASGTDSHAEGSSSVASSDYSHAEGYFCNTSVGANFAHAEGYNSFAFGISSHAEGVTTEAIGNYSHAEGGSTWAVGECSHAQGFWTVASGAYQNVMGQHNTQGNDTQAAVIIGDGVDDSNRHDLAIFQTQSITFNANITMSGLPTTEPTTTGSLWISGSSTASPNSGYLMIFNP